MTERSGDAMRTGGIAAALAFVVVAVLAADRAAALRTSDAAGSGVGHAADVLAALALLAAGALAWQLRSRRLAVVALAAGAAWSAYDWIGWVGAPAARTAGALAAPLLVPLLAQLAFGRRAPRGLLVLLYAATAATAVGLVLLRDPFADVDCWRNCTDDVLLVRNTPAVASVLEPAAAWVAAAGGAAIALLSLRERAWPAIAVGTLLCVFGLRGGLTAAGPEHAAFLLRAAAVTWLAVTICHRLLAARRSQLALARLGRELAADPPGGLRALLARTLRDPGLEVGYWLPERGAYLDLDGRTVAPPADTSRTATSLVRNGRPVALIVHARRLHEELRLERHFGMGGALAADNERLRAELSAHLEDLRLARSRLVAAADDQRRRLERDLHDSAQQRLLAVSYDLRLAESAARSAHEQALAARLAGAREDVTAVLAALRRLARGIYPAILDEAGLGPALETLGDLAPVPLEIRAAPAERLPPPVALAIYLLVDATARRAAAAGGSHIVVEVRHEGAHVTTEIASDTVLEVPVTLQDRLGALGGRALAGERGVHAEVPCA